MSYLPDQIPDEGPTFLVNYVTGKHTGAFSTRTDALLARMLAPDAPNWAALDRAEFDEFLARTGG